MSKRLINFPPGAQPGDTFSLWVFDGNLWNLDQASGASVKWADLEDKPGSIDSLGIDNEVSSGAYVPAPGKIKADKFWSEKK